MRSGAAGRKNRGRRVRGALALADPLKGEPKKLSSMRKEQTVLKSDSNKPKSLHNGKGEKKFVLLLPEGMGERVAPNTLPYTFVFI